MTTLREKTEKGLFWGVINSGSMQLLNLVIGIFLARLLTPADYGILGMIAIFSSIAGNLQDSGFGVALINLKQIEHKHYNAVFWLNILISSSFYLVLFFCAPLISQFFHEPRLTDVSRFVFLALLFSASGIAPNAHMTRRLMVKEKTIIAFVAMLISGIVGIVLAFNGFSYWSLAWQQLIFNLIICIGRFVYARWSPSFEFDFSPIRGMFGFSNKLLITSILNTLNNNILSAFFGRMFTPKDVGNYTQANKWNSMAYSLISTTVAHVAQPVLAEVNGDSERQCRVFRKMLRFTALLSFPAMFGLALVAQQFIVITLSDKWIGSILLLQILCIGGAFMPFHVLYQNLFISRSKSDIYMWFNVSQMVIQLITIYICHYWGIEAMVAGFTAISVMFLLPWQWMAKRHIGIRMRDAFLDICPFITVAAVSIVATYFVTLAISNIYLLFALRILVAMILYFGILRLLQTKILDESLAFLKTQVKTKARK